MATVPSVANVKTDTIELVDWSRFSITNYNFTSKLKKANLFFSLKSTYPIQIWHTNCSPSVHALIRISSRSKKQTTSVLTIILYPTKKHLN